MFKLIVFVVVGAHRSRLPNNFRLIAGRVLSKQLVLFGSQVMPSLFFGFFFSSHRLRPLLLPSILMAHCFFFIFGAPLLYYCFLSLFFFLFSHTQYEVWPCPGKHLFRPRVFLFSHTAWFYIGGEQFSGARHVLNVAATHYLKLKNPTRCIRPPIS